LENLPDQGEWNLSNRFGKWVWYHHSQSHLYMHWHYELEPEMSIANGPSLLKMAIFPELSDARQHLTSNWTTFRDNFMIRTRSPRTR
jgi:hypothetical protein